MVIASAALRGPPLDPAGRVPLPRTWFERPTVELARQLLGCWLVRETPDGATAGIIVETEAYGGPDDRASHARAGRTARTAPMFGAAGHAYVYLIYGLHSCLNVVAERDGEAGAVLIRAFEPIVGRELMRLRRGRPHDPDARLAAGPARVCQALAVDRSQDGTDLTRATGLWISDPDARSRRAGRDRAVVQGRRVGVAYAGDGWAERPWRFGIRGHPSLSRPFLADPL